MTIILAIYPILNQYICVHATCILSIYLSIRASNLYLLPTICTSSMSLYVSIRTSSRHLSLSHEREEYGIFYWVKRIRLFLLNVFFLFLYLQYASMMKARYGPFHKGIFVSRWMAIFKNNSSS